MIPLLGETATEKWFAEEWVAWLAEAFGVAVGVGGFAAFVLFGGALGLYNWSESFKVPAVWLAIMAPTVAVALPVPVVGRVVGIVTVALAMLFVGIWVYWRRL